MSTLPKLPKRFCHVNVLRASLAGNLKPLGKPPQNARKWFATVEIERMSCDPDWLDKAVRIVEKQIQEMNRKQRGKAPDVAMAS
jgi:hypothetical protein